jgi:hypothetical protein
MAEPVLRDLRRRDPVNAHRDLLLSFESSNEVLPERASSAPERDRDCLLTVVGTRAPEIERRSP